MALDAQAALLPYALLFFAVGLAMFAWAASFAANADLMILSLAIFAINWGVFYALASTVRRDKALAANAERRTRIHILGALLWAGSIAQISLFALGAGPAREALLILASAGAMACYFFLAPVLPALLLAGPLVAAGPVICLFMEPQTRQTGTIAGGALALGMALALVVNRIVERQFALTLERDALNTGLDKARAAAEQLARSKSALLTTLGREVRNGLAGVTHVLEAAAGPTGRTAPSREQLGAALGASRDLVGVLDATLDSESAESGALAVARTPFDGVSLVRDVVCLHRPTAASLGLELSVFVEPELEAGGAVIGDAARTRQVVSSLLGNALKYTVRGRVEVRLRREGDRIRFEVADTGPGLSLEDLNRAFQPFERIERTCAGAGGAGLGLSLARALARLMGGDIGAESAPGAGSCFWLDLPYDAQAASPAAPAADLRKGALNVLIALDDRLTGVVLRSVFEALGHQVLQAQDAARGAELLQTCGVDMIVAGQAEAIAALRAADATSPILALIDGEAEETAACLAAGASGVLRRPLTAPAVARALAALSMVMPAANAA